MNPQDLLIDAQDLLAQAEALAAQALFGDLFASQEAHEHFAGCSIRLHLTEDYTDV